MCIDRPLALQDHELMQGHLIFLWNEFAHSEWIKFPQPEKVRSQHCHRHHWESAEEDLLRYKAFNELIGPL